MEYNYSAPETTSSTSPGQQTASVPLTAAGSSRPRGRRQYAVQQYDFNASAPAPNAPYDQQPMYPSGAQGYQQGQPTTPAIPQSPQYAQQQTFPQPGYQYGHEYQSPAPNVYQQDFQGQTNVSGVTNQFQRLQVAQVILSYLGVLIVARSYESFSIRGSDEHFS
jgi:hypothetical protein